ncbi:uncharacterized protein V1518DRAFT_420284 [Limtongia smithiae]|uniref:uncharacterized protein n=1 Tax=Limtongia smithiae TaxID=1125753 RepID=UPI0034CFF2A3
MADTVDAPTAALPAAVEGLDELLARHRKEQRDLVAATTSLRKSATKGEKRKKKQVLEKCETMERELATRHAEELRALENGGGSEDQEGDGGAQPKENGGEESEEAAAERLLAQLLLDVGTSESAAAPAPQPAPQEAASGPRKKNRQRERAARKKAEIERVVAQAELEAETQPDLRAIERDNIKTLADRQGFVEFDITPDGHCLFASLADQLRARHGVTTTVADLRARAAAHMRGDPSTFAPFLFDEETLTTRELEPYCTAIESTALWGGDMEILALAREYDCPVNIVMSGRAKLTLNETGTKEPLWIAFYRHSYGLGEHYNSLRNRGS